MPRANFFKLSVILSILILSFFAIRTNLKLLKSREKISFVKRAEKIPSSTVSTYSRYQVSSGQRAYNHSPSVFSLESGDLIAVWYSGDREGGAKMQLRSKRFNSDLKQWEGEKVVLERKEIPYLTRRIGNPIIFMHPEEKESLFIIFTSTLFGWSTSYLNIIKSTNGGESWQDFKRLYLGNFFNFSHLVRCKPIFLEKKRIIIPIYHEFINKFGLLLELDLNRSKRLIQSTKKISKLREAIQPSVLLEKNLDFFLALLRNTNETDQSQKLIFKEIALKNNTKRQFYLPIKNKDTPVSVIFSDKNKILLSYTDADSSQLNLGMLDYSRALGRSNFRYQDLLILEKEPSKYPYMIRDAKQNNLIHVVYSKENKKGKEIRHIAITDQFIAKNSDNSRSSSKLVDASN